MGWPPRSETLQEILTSLAKGGDTRQTLNKVVNGKSGISPEMAVWLTNAFGSTKATRLGMQPAYALAHNGESEIKVRWQHIPRELHSQ
jgi:addiction module HigA family antidote